MASKLELTFNDPGIANQTITIKTGATYTFKTVRQSFRQVKIGDVLATGSNFKDAFNTDDNYLNNSTVTYKGFYTDVNGDLLPNPYSVVTIENSDNTFFNGFLNGTTFITSSLTTTAQELIPALDVALLEAATDKCGKYKLTIDSNVVNGRIEIYEYLSGTPITINTDSTPYEVEFNRPTSFGNGIVKLFEDQTTTNVLLNEVYSPPIVLSLNSVTVTGSPFGASATVNTNNGLSLTYSLDNVSFQGSKEFVGLLEGSYTAYVKDTFGCLKSKSFVVTEEQASALSAPPLFEVPIHNSIRFADRNGESFLSLLSKETPGHVVIDNYASQWLTTDSVQTQFRSSHETNRAFIIDCDGNETELGVIKKSDNISRQNVYDGNYTDKEGRLAVYFTSGNIYESDGVTPKSEGHLLNGNLPLWYEEGLFLRIEGVGVTQIDRLLFDETDEIVYAITQKDAIPDGLNVKITSIHTPTPFEVYEFDTSMSRPEGKYQIRIEYDTDFALSEPLMIQSELDERSLAVQWYNKRNNRILYNTGIRQFRRIEWEDYFHYLGRSEIETYDTDTSVEKVNSKSFAVYGLNLSPMPMEVARGLKYGIDNSSTVIIEGVKFVAEKEVSLERLGAYYMPKLELTLVDQTMDGQQELVDVISTGFLRVDTDSNGTAFLKI